MDADPTAENGAVVEWRRIAPDTVSPPVVERVPYLELKLEHPDLEPTGYADQFYPDGVPYELGGTERTFYWRRALSPSSAHPTDWRLACATTHELAGIDSLPAPAPALTTEDGANVAVVVGGTVAGDATTAHLQSYAPPTVSIGGVSDSAVELNVDETTQHVSAGDRRRLPLADQSVDPAGSDTTRTTVTPELVVRYPGTREVHHPAPGASHRLFPCFGLDLCEVPNPLAVPTTAGELDDSALATALGVDMTERPYTERVLWQAFVYTAFDPHAKGTPELAQQETGHIVLRTD